MVEIILSDSIITRTAPFRVHNITTKYPINIENSIIIIGSDNRYITTITVDEEKLRESRAADKYLIYEN